MHIANSEWKIMNLLWEKKMSVSQLTTALSAEKGWTKHTVIVLLKRLEERGCISYETIGRTKWFYPIVDRGETTFEATEEFLSRIYSGSCVSLFNNLVSNNAISEEELEALKALINK